MKSLFRNIGIGIPLMLVVLIYPHERCAGKSGISTKNIGEIDRALSSPQIEHCAHRVGKLWMSVTNWGHFGYEGNGADFTSWDCPRSGNRGRTSFPSAEFPGGSGINYLFQGALWIGAIVDNDTLVSVGSDGWEFVNEMYPPGAPYGGLNYRSTELSDPDYDPSAVSEFDIVADYADSLTDPSFVQLDPYDARPHTPLGLKIVQESYSWSASAYEEFIMFRYRIKNIGNHYLHQVFCGLYFDCDIWHATRTYGFMDDISGSYRCFDPARQTLSLWPGQPTMTAIQPGLINGMSVRRGELLAYHCLTIRRILSFRSTGGSRTGANWPLIGDRAGRKTTVTLVRAGSAPRPVTGTNTT